METNYPFFELGKHTVDGKNVAKFATEQAARTRADELAALGYKTAVCNFTFGADYWYVVRVNKNGGLFNIKTDAE